MERQAMKNYIVYCQDKRARKREIPRGTRKYPIYQLGVGYIKNHIIHMIEGFPTSMDSSLQRFYLYETPDKLPIVREDIAFVLYVGDRISYTMK